MEDSYYTFAWIKECWGEQKARPMAKAVIVCSGATMGECAFAAFYCPVPLVPGRRFIVATMRAARSRSDAVASVRGLGLVPQYLARQGTQ